MERLSPHVIRCDGDTQSREFNDETTITEYKEAMLRGEKFAPVVVFFDGTDYWLGDGFHRVRAAKDGEIETLDADVREGTRRDAILFSVGANATHGLKRSTKDKQKAVRMLLDDEEWGVHSDNWIAEKCGVHDGMVASQRAIHPKFKVPDSGTSMRIGKNGVRQPSKKARATPKAPEVSNLNFSGAGLSFSPLSKNNEELPTLLPQDCATGQTEVLQQSLMMPVSECQRPELEESSVNENNNLPTSSASLKSHRDVCEYMVEHGDELRTNEGHLLWLIEEARGLLEGAEIR